MACAFPHWCARICVVVLRGWGKPLPYITTKNLLLHCCLIRPAPTARLAVLLCKKSPGGTGVLPGDFLFQVVGGEGEGEERAEGRLLPASVAAGEEDAEVGGAELCHDLAADAARSAEGRVAL